MISASVDERWMQRALRLAVLGRHASPNPMVGCVIVDTQGRQVGSGFHPEPGRPHAEVFALRQAGAAARGATAYVTLEPCSHYGRTPPCAASLIESGVARVVVAMTDPDVRVSGAGIAQLAAAGVAVDVGILEAEARRLNLAYIFHRTAGLPWVTVKIASTLDGKTATASGDSRWITGPVTRRWVHRQLRDRNDAIVVGVNTVLADNPSLTTRLSGQKGRNPLRVILDSRMRIPLDSNVVRQSEVDGRTIVASLASFAQEKRTQLEGRGVIVLQLESDNKGRVDLRQLLELLGTQMEIGSVLMEGGSTVVASALELGLVNRYIATIAPKLVGGSAAPGAIGGPGLASTMSEAMTLRQWRVRRSSADLVIDALLS